MSRCVPNARWCATHQVVRLASAFRFLVGALPPSHEETADGETIGGRQRRRVRGAGRLDRHAAPGTGVALPVGTAAAVRETLVFAGSSTDPPPELAALLAHVARSLPLEAPT